jgi:GNAT superfamily N-acetyltransferase
VRFDSLTIEKYVQLFETCLPNSDRFNARYLRWLYVENPGGFAVGFDAWEGERLAAQYVAVPIKVVIAGSTTSALLSLNTATHPEFQGRGFAQLEPLGHWPTFPQSSREARALRAAEPAASQRHFALRLPPPGRPLRHAHALQLQCGGLAALRSSLDVEERDVHGLVSAAHDRHETLLNLPWDLIVPALAAWKPRRAGS